MVDVYDVMLNFFGPRKGRPGLSRKERKRMGRMSQLHAETASDRADAAESDGRYLAEMTRTGVADLLLLARAIGDGNFSPNETIAVVRRIANDLANAAGKGV